MDEETRRSAWPRVCGIAEIDARAFRDAAERTHADAAVVGADCARSLWAFTSAWREADREAARVQLRRVIDAAVNAHGEGTNDARLDDDGAKDAKDRRRRLSCAETAETRVRYYQGFHDVCSVLLLNCGETIACGVAERLAVFHLRDATRAHLAPLLDSLSLVPPLLEAADREMHAHVFGAAWVDSARDHLFTDVLVNAFALGTPREPEAETHARAGLRRCVFAVAWQMTWHVHGVGDLCGGTRVAPPPDASSRDDEATDDETSLARDSRRASNARAARADAFRLRVASRLVDFFLAAHPAMPLYVGVEAMVRDRARLLTVGRDEPAELHVALSKLPVAPDWRPSEASAEKKETRADAAADDDAAEAAAFAALETSLASARELFRAYPPDVMYRRARVEPPAGCAHAKYPYPWLRRSDASADASARGARDADATSTSEATSFLSSLSRAPLPPEVFREDRDGRRAPDSDDDGAWRRSPSRKRRALALRARLTRLAATTAPPALGALGAVAVAYDLASAERVERAFAFKTADACTDPIFRELARFAVFAVARAAARLVRARDAFANDLLAAAKTVAAVAAVSVSIARGSGLRGISAAVRRWLGAASRAGRFANESRVSRWLDAASRAGRFANESWYARSRMVATAPRDIAR